MKKIGVVVIFGGISFVFIFMGYNTFGPTTSGYAAAVNNSIITLYEHQNLSNRMINFYSEMFGDSFDMSETQIEQIRQAALEQLIGEEALSQKASEIGLVVAPEIIRDEILAIEAFKPEGIFSRSYYETYLSNQGLTPAKFEEQIKKSVLVRMANDLISKGITLTKKEIENLWVLENTKFNLEFVKIDKDLNMDIQTSEIEKFMAENKEDILKYYQNNQNEFSEDEQIKASHILISTQKEGMTDKKALELANNVLDKTKEEDFAQIAKSISDDPGSGENGGDLGYFSKGTMVKEFEDVAFSMNVGEIKGPIKTQFGYHIIKLLDKKTSSLQSLSETSFSIAKNLITKKKKALFTDKLNSYLKEGQKSGIDKLIKEYGFSWQETGEYSLNDEEIPNVGTKPMILEASYKLSKEKPLYDKLIQDGHDLYVIFLKQKTLADKSQVTYEFIENANEEYKTEILNKFREDAVNNSRISRNLSFRGNI